MLILKKIYKLLMLFFIGGSLSLAGCNGDDGNGPYDNGNGGNGNGPGANEVWMQNTSFVPESKTVSAGTTVIWTNQDPVAHTVVSGAPGSPSGMFSSGSVGGGGTFSFTFDSTGTFPYYCSVHPTQMQGTIIVQ